MQSAGFKIQKSPTVIMKVTAVAIISMVMLAASSLFTAPKANAWASFMLVDAPACSSDCPYGPERILKRFSKVHMLCYKDMRWRTTNGQYSNRWFKVRRDFSPYTSDFTPAPAVGNQMTVGRCL